MLLRRNLLIWLLFVCFLAGVIALRSWPLWRPATVADFYGGQEALAIIRQPETIEVFRLLDGPWQESIDGYKTVSGPKRLGAKQTHFLRQWLPDPKSYDWSGAAKGCEPMFGVRLRFAKGKRTVDVVFCFECDILSSYVNGRYVGDANFDPVHAELAGWAKDIFPYDPDIRAIKTK